MKRLPLYLKLYGRRLSVTIYKKYFTCYYGNVFIFPYKHGMTFNIIQIENSGGNIVIIITELTCGQIHVH